MLFVDINFNHHSKVHFVFHCSYTFGSGLYSSYLEVSMISVNDIYYMTNSYFFYLCIQELHSLVEDNVHFKCIETSEL